MHGQDFYTVLGVDRTATQQEIRQAFRRLVRRLHPDGAEGQEADAERLREVLEAYSVLRHPDRRAAYDQALRRAEGASPLWADFLRPAREPGRVSRSSTTLTCCGAYSSDGYPEGGPRRTSSDSRRRRLAPL